MAEDRETFGYKHSFLISPTLDSEKQDKGPVHIVSRPLFCHTARPPEPVILDSLRLQGSLSLYPDDDVELPEDVVELSTVDVLFAVYLARPIITPMLVGRNGNFSDMGKLPATRINRSYTGLFQYHDEILYLRRSLVTVDMPFELRAHISTRKFVGLHDQLHYTLLLSAPHGVADFNNAAPSFQYALPRVKVEYEVEWSYA